VLLDHLEQMFAHRKAVLRQANRWQQHSLERQRAALAMCSTERSDAPGHSYRPTAVAWDQSGQRLGRRPAAIERACLILAGDEQKGVPADAARVWEDDAEHGRRTHSRIHRIAAAGEQLDASAGRERVPTGNNAAPAADDRTRGAPAHAPPAIMSSG
jgi:hypothetical protein